MNERIKELAEQAEEYADAMVDEGSDFHPEYTQKLAELLLKECIDKISQEQDVSEQNWQCKNGVHICHELTKHFGVEE